MITLNLTAESSEQIRIKEYLEQSASEVLAEKINNGVKIIKDGKTLISKKDLNSFWNYATEEARKISAKGARGAYVNDETVFGWAIHYFEEDSIEGKLYNEDGTEYNPTPKVKPITNTPKPPVKVEEKDKQTSLFDLLNEPTTEMQEEIIKPQEENIVITESNEVVDTETGEILTPNLTENSNNDEIINNLSSLLEIKLKVR